MLLPSTKFSKKVLGPMLPKGKAGKKFAVAVDVQNSGLVQCEKPSKLLICVKKKKNMLRNTHIKKISKISKGKKKKEIKNEMFSFLFDCLFFLIEKHGWKTWR